MGSIPVRTSFNSTERKFIVAKKIKGNLPDKPSELIRVALADLRKVERSKKFEVDMGTWFDVYNDDSMHCYVCFAGSVMAGSLGCTPEAALQKEWDGFSYVAAYVPEHFDEKTQCKLYALDDFRTGNIKNALNHMRIKLPRFVPEDVDVVSYAYDPAAWRKDMNALALFLENNGL